MSEEVDPKAPEWYRLEITKLRDQRRQEQEAANAARSELLAKLEAANGEKAALAATAQKAQSERDRATQRLHLHREGATSDRVQRTILRDFEEMRTEMGEAAPDFAAFVADYKKDPEMSVFFKAPSAAPAPVAAPVAAPAPAQAAAPSPAAANVDRGVVVAPAVLAKDKDREVVELHRAGKLTGEALRTALKDLGLSEEQAKALVR